MPCRLKSTILVTFQSYCQPDISKLGSQIGIQKNIAGLQVFVDIERVGVVEKAIEGISHVVGNLNYLHPCKAASVFVVR